MLADKQKLFAYDLEGYWKERGHHRKPVGGQHGPAQHAHAPIDLYDKNGVIYGATPGVAPHYLAPGAVARSSLITEGCEVYGRVEHSVCSRAFR